VQTSWVWHQAAQGDIIADVAYDLFTSPSPGGSNTNEIMIWLASFNENPIAFQYRVDGAAVVAKSNISLAGYAWCVHCHLCVLLPVVTALREGTSSRAGTA
jgi:xyloglucan-specific endo-beta-1,4-glucanase